MWAGREPGGWCGSLVSPLVPACRGRSSGGWSWFQAREKARQRAPQAEEGLLQLLPPGLQGKGPHQPAERRAVLHALQQLLQPLPRLDYSPAALSQALRRQLRTAVSRGDDAVELAEAAPCLADLLLELGRKALEAGGQAL